MNEPILPIDLKGTIQTFKVIVLLIDDQLIVAEAVKQMLKDQEDIDYHSCLDPNKALSMAETIKPTVILLDLVMPEIDGLTLVKKFRSVPSMKEIPIIVLSSKEDAQVKADALALGANDYLVKLPNRLELIARIRYHSNAYIRLLERNDAYKRLEESQNRLQKELAEAAAYVTSLLPPLLTDEIKTDWRFIPSTLLGGDIFGYHWLDSRYFSFYLLDVCGHGVGAALLSISIANVLRFQTLPKTNFYDPKSVLNALNAAFQMEDHNNMFFTILYGVFDRETRQILYSSGGHPPGILMTGENPDQLDMLDLKTPGVVIGAFSGSEYQNASCTLKKYNQLYIYSDGAYEITRPDRTMMNLEEFIHLLKESSKKDGSKLDDIVEIIQTIQGKKEFDDDFSLVKITF